MNIKKKPWKDQTKPSIMIILICFKWKLIKHCDGENPLIWVSKKKKEKSGQISVYPQMVVENQGKGDMVTVVIESN